MWGRGSTQGGSVSITQGICVLTIDNPPANTLTHAVRSWLSGALNAAIEDPEVRCIVLMGGGAGYAVGVDVEDYDTILQTPSVAALCTLIEQAPKPVLAVLQGPTLGAGLELALAAHYRIAHRHTKVGFPEVKLGMVPAGGGTQRAPRLIGAQATLELLLSGSAQSVTQDRLKGLIDSVFTADARKQAQAFAEQLCQREAKPRRTGDGDAALGDVVAFRAAIEKHRSAMRHSPEEAPKEAVNCVEAAGLLPLEAGLEFERAAFEACIDSSQSYALRQTFFGERRAVLQARPNQQKFPLARIAVLGAGSLAAQIVVTALSSNLAVTWGVKEPSLIEDCRTRLDRLQSQALAAGLLTPEDQQVQNARLAIINDIEAVDEGDIILNAARGQGAIASDPDIPRFSCVPDRVNDVALRFVHPVFRSRLVEVIEGPNATSAQLNAAFVLAERLKKLPVRIKSPGLTVSERMMAALHRAADALVDDGLSPYEVDAAMLAWGWHRPPFQLRDVLGLQVSVTQIRMPGAQNWSARLIEAGRRGRGRGGGFYNYDDDGQPRPTRAVLDIVNAQRQPKRRISKAMAQTLILAALANEGARTIENGWVQNPSDIDLVCLYALDFPRWRGGPMAAADITGLFNISRAMRAFGHADRPFWTPHGTIDELVKNGRSFASMNS